MCPQYDYTCPACGATKEEIISLSEYDPTFRPICPACQESMARELSASPGMVFGYSAANGYGSMN